MRHDIFSIKHAGAHGVVLGVLSPHGAVDEAVLLEFVRLSAPCVHLAHANLMPLSAHVNHA